MHFWDLKEFIIEKNKIDEGKIKMKGDAGLPRVVTNVGDKVLYPKLWQACVVR